MGITNYMNLKNSNRVDETNNILRDNVSSSNSVVFDHKRVNSIRGKLVELAGLQDPAKRFEKLESTQAVYDEILKAKYDMENKMEESSAYGKSLVKDEYQGLCQELTDAKKVFKNYFIQEIEKQSLKTDSFEDFEEYIVNRVSSEEFYCTIFLYTQANFDTRDLNRVIKTPRQVFESKQGECDDISFFVDHFARKRKDTGKVVQQIFGTRIMGLEGHFSFFIEKGEDIISVDEGQYFRLNKKKYGLDSYKDILFKYKSKVSKAVVIDSKLCESGRVVEINLNNNLPLEKFDYIRTIHKK